MSYFVGFDVVKIDIHGAIIPQPGETVEVYNLSDLVAEDDIETDDFGVIASQSIAVDSGTSLEFSVSGYAPVILRGTQVSPDPAGIEQFTLVLEDLHDPEFIDAAWNDIFIRESPNSEPKFIGTVESGGTLDYPFNPQTDFELEIYAIARSARGTRGVFDLGSAVKYTLLVNRGSDVPVISQFSEATNTSVVIYIVGSPNALFRKIEESETSDFAVITNEWIQEAADYSGVLPSVYTVTTPSEEDAKVRYYRVSHSSNGEAYGMPSLGLEITFADDLGAGGSVATPPTLGALSFDSGTDTVSGAITNNGGTGDISVHRQFSSGGFAVIATGSFSSMVSSGLVNVPTVDGTYDYKLSQAGIAGFSETRSITVDVDEPGATEGANSLELAETLTASARITWFEFGALGDVRIYRKDGFGGWFELASVSAGVLEYTDTAFLQTNNYRYKLTQDGTLGESNTIYVTVFV